MTKMKNRDKIIKKISEHQAKLDKLTHRNTMIHKAYDYNFSKILSCKKKSEKHMILLTIEDVLNEETKTIKSKIARFTELIATYQAQLQDIPAEV